MNEDMASDIDRELELTLRVEYFNMRLVEHLRLLEWVQLSLISKLESQTATSDAIKEDKNLIEELKKNVNRLEEETEEAEKTLREFREKQSKKQVK